MAAPKYPQKDTSGKAWVSRKIGKIMDEGIRGKKVPQKQAVAVAYAMQRQRQQGH